MRSRRRTRTTLAHAVGLLLLVGCGSTTTPSSSQDTIGLGGGSGTRLHLTRRRPGSAAPPLSPLGISSSCIAQIEGDLRQQMVSPSAAASVRTDHWLSLEQVAAYGIDDGTAPLDGWLSMSCTLPNGDTVTARTLDSTPIDQVPVTPATHVVAPGLPDDDRVVADPSGAATLAVLVTVGDVLFAPVDGGTAWSSRRSTATRSSSPCRPSWWRSNRWASRAASPSTRASGPVAANRTGDAAAERVPIHQRRRRLGHTRDVA